MTECHHIWQIIMDLSLHIVLLYVVVGLFLYRTENQEFYSYISQKAGVIGL